MHPFGWILLLGNRSRDERVTYTADPAVPPLDDTTAAVAAPVALIPTPTPIATFAPVLRPGVSATVTAQFCL